MLPDYIAILVCQSQDEDVHVTIDADIDDHDYTYTLDADEHGHYVELCFTDDMSNIILAEHQRLHTGDIATLRVYVTQAAKRAVVVKDDDILTRQELKDHAAEVSKATVAEIKIWLQNNCFRKCLLKGAQNTTTSRYVAK